MVSLLGFLFIYVLGGITFLPIVALAAFLYIKGGLEPWRPKSKPKPDDIVFDKDPDSLVKQGWIRLTNQYQPKMPEIHASTGLMSGIQSYVSGNHKKSVFYAVLERGILTCYESEKQHDAILALAVREYQVSLYPSTENRTEGEFFNRASVIRLTPTNVHDVQLISSTLSVEEEEEFTHNPTRVLYLTCARNTDKEDWYFGLVQAHHYLADQDESTKSMMIETTHFDPPALEKLIYQVQVTPSSRETAWLNAILGRLFLSIYKTDRLKRFVEMKIRTKIDKTKRPTFLDEIHVRSVDVGQSLPCITCPKLLSLSPEGEVVVESQIDYTGGLTIEIETDFHWSYSSRMKPIRMHLILAVKLKQLKGRMMFKIKAPPTNRYWVSFFEMPDMEWEITPIVADKLIKLNIVTNAIESRIREVMAETFVLPNMDDTAFCPSDGQGGIFGDYVQVKTKKSSLPPTLDHIRETPAVPELDEKTEASDVLKLKNRHAASAVNLMPENDSILTNHASAYVKKLEVSHSTPEMHPPSKEETTDQHAMDNSSKWSANAYIRKRMKKNDEDHSDAESMASFKSNQTTSSGSKFFNKISSLLPDSNSSDNLDSASVLANKKNSLINMAGSFLTKKVSHDSDEDDSSTHESKKQWYAERMANLRKRAEERKHLSVSSHGSSSSSSLSLLEKTEEVSPPAKPRRHRAASLMHQQADSVPENTNKPPLPPRRYSTPPVFEESYTQKPSSFDIKPPILAEEEKYHQQQQEQEEGQQKEELPLEKPHSPSLPSPPPLPSTPRPKRSPQPPPRPA
ncbi:putative integral membrane protein conserved region-domain-containing protein [Gilbertella persicaria]|uniref:putative integral membrane protein conserved region-domain-containing protein n=1 Tax=Gilbertella persicaria TaxID=101096 RepID=UPI002220D40E|nr:putative integral membrane protein conserved region-domain-containing protein [Gilbertella persicaria]KAI8091347.1 putative integral membrane protein conserved region-domain-containing protein [Gilbertella persicaria]